jgi:sirohydrochlorin ferrochelatase
VRALLIVAHGSRREASNEEVRGLTWALAKAAGDAFDHVDCAFLELADPSIPDGIQHCIDAGADEVVVLPYFLSAGRHVSEDIPAQVRLKQQEHPRVSIHVAPYLGSAPGVVDLLLETAARS